MKILVTGAAGFIGSALVGRLLTGGIGTPVTRLVLADVRAGTTPVADPRVEWRMGDVGDRSFAAGLVDRDTAVVFHLAGVVSGAAEADFDLGMRVNLHGTLNLLEAARATGAYPRFVFASSIAVFGAPLPSRIDDETMPAPTLSYGAQKLACEHIVDDYARRDFVDGIGIRLPGVVVRPALANGALSAFNSDIFREPLAGRAMTVPVSPGATIWIASLDRSVDNLLIAARTDTGALGSRRVVTLPVVAASIAEIVDASSRASGRELGGLVSFAPDPAIETMFGRWPRDFAMRRAHALGFVSDANLDAIVRTFLDRS